MRGFASDHLVENLGEVHDALKTALAGYARDRFEAARQMNEEDLKPGASPEGDKGEVSPAGDMRRSEGRDDGLGDFRKDLLNRVKAHAEYGDLLARQHEWAYNVGDHLLSTKTGKTYRITGRTFQRVGRLKDNNWEPLYSYESGNPPPRGMTQVEQEAWPHEWERGIFREKALLESKTMKNLTTPRFSEKRGVEIREVPGGFDAHDETGNKIGYLRDNLERGQAKQLDENANVDIVKVNPDVKGQGVGAKLYKAFYDKHEGRVAPSGKTSPDAWRLWKRQYPEKVEAFVQDEARRIADGADPQLVLRNITDPEIATRVRQAAVEQHALYSAKRDTEDESSTTPGGREPGVVAGQRPAPAYGEPQEHSAPAFTAWHFSQEPRATLSSSAYGTGLKGSAREEFLHAEDARRRQRIYFYTDRGQGIHPESGVGAYAHEVSLRNVYDADKDPLGLKKEGGNFESAVLDHGFDGYTYRDHSKSGAAVLLGPRAVRVAYRGRGIDVNQLHDAPQEDSAAVPWRPQHSGPAAQMQDRAERMRAQPGWAGHEIRVTDAGRGFATVETRPRAQAPTPEEEVSGQGNGSGRPAGRELAPLEGAPDVKGASGPDPRIAQVAEDYARSQGIPYARQAEYAQVDEDRARRIAQAYADMPHAPDDPRVRAAYEDLTRQTLAQYRALEDHGYKFWFMDPAHDPYGGNPWNAMRDLRANQSMAVFPTDAGFGSDSNFDAHQNPLLADTGLRWHYGSPDGPLRPVLANDLFRAVHDAFGHGLEGAGFRAQGEENAWQAHARLFTGDALGALTSETRGQNSWLNYGPHGEANRTAKVEDTVFADQKTGLMPEWTWNEGRLKPSAKRDELDPEIVRTLGKHIRNLTPPERAKLRRDTAQRLVDQLTKLPSANEMAAVAYAGRAKRGWYAHSAAAIEHVFGGDAPRFAALLAALSPQTGVEDNLYNALSTWKNWVAAGRPTTREEILDVLGRSVPGDKGRGSVLDAWVNNSVRALSSEDPGKLVISGPKVNSFFKNLVGHTDEVTNDTWMANYALVDQKIFGGKLTQGGDPGKSSGYLAMSARVREAAKTLTRLTGEEWTPAEVQETIWSWAKTLYETASANKSARDILNNGELTDDLIRSTPDFRTLFHDDVNERLLRDAGLGDQVASLRARGPDGLAGRQEPGAEGEAAPFDSDTQARYEQRAAGRLDELRQRGLARDEPSAADVQFSEKRDTTERLLGSTQRLFGDSGRQYTPEQESFFKNVGRSAEHMTWQQHVASFKQDLGKRMIQGIFDQFAPIKDLGAAGKTAYALARLSKSTTGAFEALLHFGKIKITDGAYDAEHSGGLIDTVFKPLGRESEDFLWWVAANRAERLAGEGRENLFTPDDIAAGKSLADGKLSSDYRLQDGTFTRDRSRAYADAQRRFSEFNDNVLGVAEQSGLISREVRNELRGLFYVPFWREAEDGGLGAALATKGLVRQTAFKALKGGKEKLRGDMLQNVLLNYSHLLDASAKNRAAIATLDAATAMDVAYPAHPAEAKGTVWAMRNGTKVSYKVEDPHTLAALNALNYQGMNNPIMRAMGKLKRALTIGVTASPAFKVRNLVRDTVHTIAVAPLEPDVLKAIRQGWKHTDHNDPTFLSALAGGGLIRFDNLLDGQVGDRTRRLIEKGIPADSVLDSPDKVKAVMGKIKDYFDAYNHLGNRTEDMSRAALYRQLRDRGVDHAEASLASRDLLDFSMQGAWQTTRFLTQIVPFLNARLQGFYKLGRAGVEDHARLAAVIGAIAATSIGLSAAYQNDPDFHKREDWDRDNFWWFKVAGKAFRIPKPFEVGSIASLAERGADFLWDKDMTGARYGKIVRDILVDNLNLNPIPQAVGPLLDVYANTDSFTGRPIEPQGMEALRPDYRYTANSTMFSRALSTAGQAVYDATGLTQTGSRFFSPLQIDHLVDGYFGWLGSFVTAAPDLILRPVTGQPVRPAWDWWKVGSGGFVHELGSDGSYFTTAMHEQAQILGESMATYQNLLRTGRAPEAVAFAKDHMQDMARGAMLQAVQGRMGAYTEVRRLIENSQTMSADQKRQRLLAIKAQEESVAQRMIGAR
jgi:hypothetical protein